MSATLILKRLGVALLISLAISLLWYVQSRVLAPRRCTRVVEIGTESNPGRNISSIQFATYNIAHGRGGKLGASNWTGSSKKQMENHLAQIALQVNVADVDILVLNEVDFQSSWSRYINQARVIAAHAGFTYCAEQRNVDVSLPFRKYRFGNAVLSKYPITDIRVIRFPPLSRKESVFAGNHDGLIAKITTPIGEISVLAVHLEYRSEDVRVECARIIKTLASENDTPIVVMGDFNSAPSFARGHQTSTSGENAMDILLNSGLMTHHKALVNWEEYVTFPSANPDRAIDWIICSPGSEQNKHSLVRSELSDHLMVTAGIRIKTERSEQIYPQHSDIARQPPLPMM